MPLRMVETPRNYGICIPNRIVKVTKPIDAIALTGRRNTLKNKARLLCDEVLRRAVPQDLRGLFRAGA
jgi:hypothetical protein